MPSAIKKLISGGHQREWPRLAGLPCNPAAIVKAARRN
jgi:hypothetical protein